MPRYNQPEYGESDWDIPLNQNFYDLENDMGGVESDVSDLESGLNSTQSNVSTLQTDLGTAESDIQALESGETLPTDLDIATIDGTLTGNLLLDTLAGDNLSIANGRLNAQVGEEDAFDEGANYSPSGDWNFLGLLEYGGVEVATLNDVDGGSGDSFDETANYSPSGDWNFTGQLQHNADPVATEPYVDGEVSAVDVIGEPITDLAGGTSSSGDLIRNVFDDIEGIAPESVTVGESEKVIVDGSPYEIQINGTDGAGILNFKTT